MPATDSNKTKPGNGNSRVFSIRNERGLHARAAAKFVKTTGEFNADTNVSKDGQTVSGASIMGLMMLAAGIGSTIEVSASGKDAVAVLDALEQLIDDRFGEEI
ncbi:MAG: HPr family phosphocarrier protein [Rhodospirillaceae bacterium]|nr:HPr family phosphocarrier protein [Rhodospirillaceae bacterium]